MLAQAKRRGCEGGGFFSLFTGQSPECQPLNAQIQQMRDSLDRTMSDLERLKSGNNYDQDGQRRQLIGQLAQNNCGPQYRAAAAAAGPAGFLDALFGGAAHIINPGGDGAPSGTFRTVCVRACDGYYFPISYSTVQSRFADDAAHLPARMPGDRGAALYLSQSGRRHRPGRLAVAASPTPRCRPRFNIARNSTPPARAGGRARAGPTRSKAPTTPRRSKAATSSSPTRMPKRCRSRRRRKAQSPRSRRLLVAAATRCGRATARPRPMRAPIRPKGAVRTVGPPFVAAH